MHSRPPFRLRAAHSLHRHYNFSAIPHDSFQHTQNQEPLLPSENHKYAHLLQSCLQQCKQIRTRHLFDEMPQLLAHALNTSKIIHAQSLKLGFSSKGSLGNTIVDLYAKCGNVDFAEKAFNQLEDKGVLAWNSVLSMYSRRGFWEKVVECFGLLRNCGVLPNEYTYAIVLSACARMVDVVYGRQVHCSVFKMGLESSSFCEGALIDMYAKCNCVSDARHIFDGAVDLDTVSWTAMIAGYVQVGLPEEALKVFEEMQKVGRVPDLVAFVTVISACMNIGKLDYACEMFAKMPNPNVVAWNVMISGHAQRGYNVEAITYFLNMRKAGVKSTRSTLGSVLSAIATLGALDYGLLVHAQAIKQGLDSNVYAGSSLINMYAKCVKLDAAKKVFEALDEKNVVLWNAMLGGYAQNEYAHEVIQLFFKMKECGFHPDDFTYTSILSACACLEDLEMGRQLHSVIIKNRLSSNLFVGNALVDMYAKSGTLKEARKQFELISNRDNVSWNAIIVGYVQEEEEDEAFYMFRRMNLYGIVPDEVSLASILSACANVRALKQGKQVHCLSVKSGLETSLYVGGSLIDMYAKCGVIEAARIVFACMPERSVVSMNALIAGCAQNNLEEAIDLFCEMRAVELNPTEITFASILDACNGSLMLILGIQIHCLIVKWGLQFDGDFLGISLLGMYLKFQRKEDADILFSEFPNPKSTVLWTAFISGLAQNDFCEKALHLYREMRRENALPDQATFVSVLHACAVSSSLRDGWEIHSLIFHTGFDLDELTGSSLVDMYAKCGDVKSSVQVFEEMCSKNDVISWNSMIVGLAKNGYAEYALKIFDEMKQKYVMPDDVTFLGVLTACSHAGKVSEGRHIFGNMVNYYGIQPRVDHYACMVDLFGRWGSLEEAEELVDKVKFEHDDAMIWASFLGACRLHGDEIRGRRAAEKLIELDPLNSSSYVLLSNIYAASGNWDAVNFLRRKMKEKGVRKFPGCSWIEVEQEKNLFVAGDRSHTSAGEIYAILKDLTALMKEDGYVADTDSFLLEEEW